MQLLKFTLNNVDFGISVKSVESIEKQRNVIVVPDSPPHVEGIMRLHGEVVAVYSLSSRFGYGKLPVENVIVVNMGGMKIGLEVEQVKSIIEVSDNYVVPMPVIMNSGQSCFQNVVSSKNELLVLIDAGKLVDKEVLQSISEMIKEHD